jgi:hypothetical protein
LLQWLKPSSIAFSSGADFLVVPDMLMDLLATAEHVLQSIAGQNDHHQQYISALL